MHKTLPMQMSPRCGALTRSKAACQSPAMSNGRCRLHGGKSPGGPKGEANGMYRHGFYTSEAIRERRRINDLLRESAELLAD